MDKNFKPLFAQLAEKLIAEFKAGTSPIQKPLKENGLPAFVAPINPITGKGYSALNAINLALKGFDDPRWMSADSASYNGYLVKEGSKGTMISFPKRSEIQAIRTPDGEKIKDEAGVTKTKTVEFEKVQNGNAFLFNATQIKGIPSLEDWQKSVLQDMRLSPIEKAEKLIAESKAVIVHGGQEAYFDKVKDQIYLPEKNTFENETKYYHVAIHQLAHWTGHESRLNRPMEGKFGSASYGGEELRAAIASMLIGAELKLGHSFGAHASYTSSWAKLLQDKPFEITRVASDAQKIAGALLSLTVKKDIKQETPLNTTLAKGEEIAYNNTVYIVLDKKGKTFDIEKADTGERFKIKASDKVFGNLVEARNNPVKAEVEIKEEQKQKIGR